MKLIPAYFAAVSIFFTSTSLSLADVKIYWEKAEGNSCSDVCRQHNFTPFFSGVYTKGNNPYYICRANAKNEGRRPGYNLMPSWSNVCVVGWGNQELAVNEYDCLCQDRRADSN